MKKLLSVEKTKNEIVYAINKYKRPTVCELAFLYYYVKCTGKEVNIKKNKELLDFSDIKYTQQEVEDMYQIDFNVYYGN